MNQRQLTRIIHLIGSALIGTYVYSPWKDLVWFTLITQVIVIPLLALSGLWLWQGHRLRRPTRKQR